MRRASTRPRSLYYRILRYQPQNYRRLQDLFELSELDDPSQDTPDILRTVNVLFAPLGFPVGKAKIDACPDLRVIASNTTGHPHIDVDYARGKGIAVACLKFAPEFLADITPTAELAWGLIIALTRHILPAHAAALAGTWDRRPFAGAGMLSRMTLGIVGHGRLGGMVARYAKASGMRALYYDPYVSSSSEGATRCEDLAELVSRSDVVTIHVPHEPSTEGMFSRQILGRFKRGAYLINTARGELLDWQALLEALQSGQLAGVALDVFEGEFVPGFGARFRTHPLLEYARTHPNVILTPHIGGSTVDAWAATEAHTIDMVVAALQKAPELSR